VMDDREKLGRVVPARLPNNAQGGAAEAAEEGDQPRGTRLAKRAPDAVPGMARSVSLIVCAE